MRVRFILLEVFIKANMTVVGPIRPKIIVIAMSVLDISDKEPVIPVDTPTVPYAETVSYAALERLTLSKKHNAKVTKNIHEN